MGLGAFYRRSFETRPWLTLSVTNGLFSLVADVLAQTIESRTSETEAKSWDTSRSLRFLTYGTALGPLLAEWNQFLETRFTVRSATGRMLWRGLASRVAMDQLLMAPLTTGLFVGAMGIMEGRRTMDALREKYEGVRVSIDRSCTCLRSLPTGRCGRSSS